MVACLCSLLPLLLSTFDCGAEQARLSITADTSLQAHPSEVELNSGDCSALRIKGNEHYLLIKPDLEPIRGWRVEQAGLFLHPANTCQLRTMGVSTIAADWAEGSGRSSREPGGCTFTHAVWPDVRWAGPGSSFLDVALTNGNTEVFYADVRPRPDGWLELEIAPAAIQSLLAGGSYGLCVSDEKGQTRANNDVHSREQSGLSPYLLVQGAPAGDLSVPSVRIVGAEAWPAAADFDSGAVRLSLAAQDAWLLDVSVRAGESPEARTLPRYAIPRPDPAGERQTFVIGDLPPNSDCVVEVTAVDMVGRPGATARAHVTAGAARPVPRALARPVPAETRAPRELPEGWRAWVAPAECKVSPISGNVLDEVGARGYAGKSAGTFSRSNPVWDGVRAGLSGGIGEVVALKLVIEPPGGKATDVTLQFAGGPADPMPAPVGLYRNWYVRAHGAWYGEYMVPAAAAGTAIPAADNGVPGQTNQSFTIVWEVPRDATPGPREGEIAIGAADLAAPIHIPVTLWVLPFELPAETSFEVDLNCYGPVSSPEDWPAYLRWERATYAAAHALRCTLNPLGYSQSGNVYPGFAPQIEGRGDATLVTDWSGYDEHYGPYLDGSAFGGVRAGVPITHMYLPLHENWPTPMAGHYSAANDIRKYPDNIVAHALEAPPIEQAFSRDHSRAMVAVTAQFSEHFRRRGWTGTDLQCYLNNKYYYKDEEHGFRGTSWWLLDEPMHRDDWLALRFFGRLFREGAGADPRLVYRGDISRPQWQRDWLDGVLDLMCVSSALFDAPNHCGRYRRQGVTLWHYGTGNPIESSNLSAVAWALSAFCAGADGILPWNCIGGDGAFDEPTPTALLVPGGRFGIEGPVVSLRLLAMCRGQQDVEYLNLLGAKEGYDREQLARLVSDLVAFEGRHGREHADDAGGLEFSGLTLEDLHALRTAVAARLSGPGAGG